MSVKHKLLQAAAGANTGDNAWFSVLETETTGSGVGTKKISLDSAGNIYAVGRWQSSYFLVKYNKFGDVLWEKNAAPLQLDCVAINSEDDVIVGGTDDSRFYLAKLNSDGNFIWQTRYAPQNFAKFTDIAIDPLDDDICATGYEAGFNNQKDTTVMRFDTDGNLLVRKVKDKGTDTSHYMSTNPAIAANSRSEMISATYHGGFLSTGVGAILTVLGDNGSKSWAKSFDTQYLGFNDSGDGETFTDVVVNANNEIFAVGQSRSWDLDNGPGVVKIFHGDAFGNEISHKRFTLGNLYPQPSHRDHNMLPEAIAVDSESNVIVTGYTYPKGGSSKHISAFVFKATASGSVQWFRFIDCVTSSGGDVVYDVQVDNNDDIILGGTMHRDDINSPFAFVAKLPGDGSGLGEYTDGSTYRIFYREGDFTNNSGNLNPMDTDGSDFSANNNVASMESANASLSDATSINPTYMPIRETTSGYWLSHKSWDGSGSQTSNITFLTNYINDSAVDNLGNVITVGSFETAINVGDAYAIKHDSAGNVLWEKRFSGLNNEVFRGVDVDSNNNIYITGSDAHNGGNSISTVTLKLNPDGDVLWDVEQGVANGPDDNGVRVAIDSNDSVYVLAETEQLGGSETDAWIIKYNSDGTTNRLRYFGVGTNTSDTIGACDIITDSNNRVIITGRQNKQIGGGVSTMGTYLAVYDSAGNLSWQKAIYNDDQGAHANNLQRDLAVDSQDNIYLASYQYNLFGDSLTHAYLLKFDSAGNVVWERHLNTFENGGSGTQNRHKIAIDSNDNIILMYNTSDSTSRCNLVKLDTSGEIKGPALTFYNTGSIYGDTGPTVNGLYVDSNDDIIISMWDSNPGYSSTVMKIPNDFSRVEKDKLYYGLQEKYEFGTSTPIIVARSESGVNMHLGITAGTFSSYTTNVGGDVGETVVTADTSLTPVNFTSNFRYLNQLDLVPAVGDEFLTTYNYENYLVSSVTVNVDDVFSTATDQSGSPVVQYPATRYQYNRYAPGEWFERTAASYGSFMFNSSNRALVGFESDISSTDVAALIDVDFDNQTYTTLLNDTNFTSTGFNNLRYVEGGSHVFVSAGSGNQPGGYNFSTQSAFTPNLPASAGNNNSTRFYDPILNAVHEGSYVTHNETYDLWTFQANNATLQTEDASSYFNSNVGVTFRHWVPISMDEDYIYWIDNNRVGYSEKGPTVNDTIGDGTYTILSSNAFGVDDSGSNGDSWAFSESECLPDIFGNIWIYNSNSSDPDYKKYRRLYRDPTTGVPTATTVWEDPLAAFVPQSDGSYAYFYRFDSVGRPDWQIVTLRIYDAATGLTWFPKYKIYSGGTPSSSAYNYVFEGPYGLDLPGNEIDGKTLFNRTVDSLTQFTVTLHRIP
jgi:hypothetical protein